MFWKCTYSEMILGGLLLLQFKPSHENSLGTHGSPCQFLATLYSSLMSMIASNIVFYGKQEFIDDHSKRKWVREAGEFKIQNETKIWKETIRSKICSSWTNIPCMMMNCLNVAWIIFKAKLPTIANSMAINNNAINDTMFLIKILK